MTKVKNILQILTLFLMILLPSLCFSQANRSIDDEKFMKKQKSKHYRPSPEERYVMKIEKKKAHDDNKKDRIDRRLHKRAVKKHNRLINGGEKEKLTGKKTWKRMKKSKRMVKN
jgi:hypothetical protein